MKTDDKLTSNTKKLIEESEKIRKRNHKDVKDKIAYVKLRKLVKKEIRTDLKEYEIEAIKRILQENWSLRKIKKESSSRTRLITKLKGKNNLATKFYE